MSSKAWNQLYRPDTIAGLHSNAVREQLQKLLKSGRFPQVLLLAGPRGMGKTSTARILAAMFNDPANETTVKTLLGLDKNNTDKKSLSTELKDPDYSNPTVAQIKAGSSLAVIELDAASHRGIDDVRSLKEQVYLPPQDGLVKVVILDEVHMLTTEAFNALLKILEEPPTHALFVLATTELHKIPATVASRATLIQFKQATPQEIQSALEKILANEKIKFDQEGISAIAVAAQGSFRDALKLAELVVATQGELTGDAVLEAVPRPIDSELASLHQAIVSKNSQEVVTHFESWRQRRIDTALFAQVWLTYLHTLCVESILKQDASSRVLRFLLQEFSAVSPNESSVIPLLGFELKALDLIFRSQDKKSNTGSGTNEASSSSTGSSPKKAPIQKAKAAVEHTEVIPQELTPVAAQILETVVEPISPPEDLKGDNFVIPSATDSTLLLEKWQEFVEGVKQKNSTVAAILNSAQPQRGDKGQALIDVFYNFHKEQLQQPKFRKLLDDSVLAVLGSSVTFEFRVAEPPLKMEVAKEEDVSSLAAEILV